MAKVIEFYVPDRMRERRLWSPPEQRGRVIQFSSKITGVTSQLNGAKPSSCSQSMVPLTPVREKKEETSCDSPIKRLRVMRPSRALALPAECPAEGVHP
jgi:hypothetical protein